jgi:AcrR family transcriptional regulator
VAEIKRLAWSQIASSGAGALSLRAVAREMGMTSSALYRYYESRDQLLDALVADAFASLADCLEEAERSVAKAAWDERSMGIYRNYRRWALAHPTEYALMFGGPIPGFDSPGPVIKQELFRGVSVLFRCMVAGLAEGSVHPPPLSREVEKKLRAKLKKWGGPPEGGLSSEALAACMTCWTQLHGAISLELFGHLPEALIPADELFEHLMRQLVRNMSVPPPVTTS